jgi:hypothetical protein
MVRLSTVEPPSVNDPAFVVKAADVVGLYVDPPAKAIVLCVDEKPSIQALERAQGYLKLPNGRALTGQSHDYKRHGTTTLFAALEVATGRIIAAHSKRRRRLTRWPRALTPSSFRFSCVSFGRIVSRSRGTPSHTVRDRGSAASRRGPWERALRTAWSSNAIQLVTCTTFPACRALADASAE